MNLFISNSRYRSFAVLSTFLLGSVALMLFFNTHEFYEWKEQRMQKRKLWNKKIDNEKYNILLLGDSRVYRGLSPNIIAQGMPHMRAYNLGFSSTIFDDFYFDFVERKLKKKGNRIIIIGLSQHLFVIKENEHLISLMKKADLSMTNTFLEKLLLYTSPVELRSFFRMIKNKPYYLGDYSSIKYHFREGWVETNSKIKGRDAALKGYEDLFVLFKPSLKRYKNFLKRISVMVKMGIKVIFFKMPTSVKMTKLEKKASQISYKQMRRDLQELGGYYIDLDDRDFLSYDASHIDGKSAKKLSLMINSYLKRIEF